MPVIYLILPFFQEVIDRRREDTLMAVSLDLPAEEEEETGKEVIPREGEGNNLAYQSFKEALLGWSWVLKDSHESLPLTEEWQCHLMVSVIYILFLFSILISIFS